MKYITQDEYNTVMNIRNEYRPKLYKRLREFRWTDPIHETVQTQPVVFDSDIEILHLPQSHHSKRDFSLFQHAFGSGQPISDKLHSMYARELLISGSDQDFMDAQPIFEQTILQTDRIAEADCSNQADSGNQRLPEAACILCHCMRLRNQLSDFFKYALQSMAYYPCSEICCELGSYFYETKDYKEAIRWYQCAANETTSILNVRTSGNLPLAGLGQCFEQLAQAHPDNADTYMQLSTEYHAAAECWKMPEEAALSE